MILDSREKKNFTKMSFQIYHYIKIGRENEKVGGEEGGKCKKNF